MSALPDHYTFENHGINWLSDRVSITEMTGDMAFERVGIYNPAGLIGHFALFNRLPDIVLASDLTPAAKLLYADIFSWVFARKNGKPVVQEYYCGIRFIAERIGMTRQGANKAVNELVAGKWISNTETARTSKKHRLKLVPLNTQAIADLVSQPEVPDPDASDDLDDCLEQEEDSVASLAESTTRPGIPMPYSVARRLPMTPVFLNLMDLVKNRITRTAEVLVYGLIVKKAKPFYFESISRIAAATGLHRSTVKRAIQRLEHLLIVAKSNDQHYVVAHPILNEKPIPQFNYLSSLIKQEKENGGS